MHEIEELSPSEFTFDKWSAGSLASFGVATRYASIEEHHRLIRNKAIGYCEGEKLYVRPKYNTVAVMFEHEFEEFWTHLTVQEFLICFPERCDKFKPKSA